MEFGLYVSATGIGSVFVALLLVAMLSEALKRMVRDDETFQRESEKRKVAAVAAALATIHYNSATAKKTETKGDASRWTVAARMESLRVLEENR